MTTVPGGAVTSPTTSVYTPVAVTGRTASRLCCRDSGRRTVGLSSSSKVFETKGDLSLYSTSFVGRHRRERGGELLSGTRIVRTRTGTWGRGSEPGDTEETGVLWNLGRHGIVSTEGENLGREDPGVTNRGRVEDLRRETENPSRSGGLRREQRRRV